MRMLKTEEVNLIREVLLKHCPTTLTMLDTIGVTPLSDEQREEIREAIADELVETGLSENDEPNERGLLLEHLIDLLAHY